MEGLTKEAVEALLAEFRTQLVGSMPDEIARAAATLNDRPETKMVFGREKLDLEQLGPKQLLGAWFTHSLLRERDPLNAVAHAAKALALVKHSWMHADNPELREVAQKALTESAEGTDLVPVEFLAEMIAKAPDISELIPDVERKTVQRDTGTVPAEGAAVTVTWGTAEAEDPTDSDPAYGQVAFNIRDAFLFTKVSNDLIADSPIAVISDVSRQFTNAMLEEQDKVVAIGNGSNQPTGISSASITQSVAISASLSFSALVEIEKQLPARYRRNARWIGATKVIDTMRGIVDSQNRPLFVTGGSGSSAPDTIMGYPLSRQDDFPLTDLWLGDLSLYYLFDRMRVELTTDNAGINHRQRVTAVLMRARMDGDVALVDGFARGTSISGIS